MNPERYTRLVQAARRVASANQEAQPREYHEAMSELEKIVAECDSPLDDRGGNSETPRMETLLATFSELVREIESNTTAGKKMMMAWDSAVCHVTTLENAKAAIQAATH